MTDTLKLIKAHRSIRKFTDQPITDQQMTELIEAAQAAPSSSFLQAYTFIDINNETLRDQIATCAADQNYVRTAARFLVVCGDNYRHAQCAEHQGKEGQFGFAEQLLTASIDAALAAQNLVIAAESMGLGIVYIGAIRNQPAEVSRLLNLPDLVIPLFGLCLGYPDQNPDIKPRLPSAAVLHQDRYDAERYEGLRQAYVDKTERYYTERTGGKTTSSWEQQMADKNASESRPGMLEFLRSKGFAIR